WEAVYRLAEEKYRSWEWTFGRSPQFTVNHKFRLESGNVDAQISVKHGIITDIELARHTVESVSTRRVISEFIGKRYDLKA
ncbi:MAG: lipoate--protein ligase, partial [Proteobacteria bacterium]|nr:lipoate--protein ligase [Pseudomonadota bacterium]